jgi:RNA polymerase sigma factor (sigma-70 family)
MQFPSTRRSAVFAVRSENSGERRNAFEALIEAYWKPVYKLIRIKWGYTAEDAADLTQGFFASAMEREFFGSYDPEKGTFRTFLRTCLDGYVANQRKSAARLKRGGDVRTVSAESELREHPPAPDLNPEEFFHREWVRSVFALALDDLRRLCAAQEKSVRFQMFERYALEQDASYADLAREFGLPLTTVTNHLAWARREFRRLLLERTAGPADVKLLLESL